MSDPECRYLYKGTKRSNEDYQDLVTMYNAYWGDEITIWCEGHFPEHLSEPPTKMKMKSARI